MFEKSASAPVSVVLKELLEGKKLTIEQYSRVLENRREILVRCMKTFSQKTLGQLACLNSDDGFYHDLYKDTPRVISLDNKFSLETRGLYAGNAFSQWNGGQRCAFGTDDESWLLIKISYSSDKRAMSPKYEKALSVQVMRTDLATILKDLQIEPMIIMMYFKIVVDEWVFNRKTLYEQACKVAEGMQEERAILNLVA